MIRTPLAAVAATLLSAGLFALAYPPFGIRPLAFVCLAPFFLALGGGGAPRALGLAWLWAVVASCGIASVFPGSIASYYMRPLWFGWAVGILLFTAMASFYYMAFAPVYRVLVRRPGLATPFLVAAAWASVELARGRLFTGTPFFIGNPWGLLGYTHASGALAQVASWTGVYGIGFALVAVNAGLTGWISALRDPARSARAAARALALATAPALAIGLGGAWTLHRAPGPSEGEGFVEMAVVQGNVSLGRRWRSDYYGRNLDVYLGLTRQALAQGRPRTVVWPESSMTFFLEREPLYARAIARVLAVGDAELLAGGPSGDGTPPAYNSVFRISPDGSIGARYDKQYLVPFSEYFPLAGLDLVRRRMEGARTFAHGAPEGGVLDTRMGRAGMLICNEGMLPEVAGDRVRAGAELLVSPSNDNWIAGEGFAEHYLAVVALRSIEQRRYLVRASTAGPSAVVDPWGRILVRTPSRSSHLLLGRVRPETELSVYGRVGDAFALACVALAAGGLLHALARTRRAAGVR
jgi:apolipoprotein N-acyltransferase